MKHFPRGILALLGYHVVTAGFLPPTLLSISCFPSFLQKLLKRFFLPSENTDTKDGSDQQEMLGPAWLRWGLLLLGHELFAAPCG